MTVTVTSRSNRHIRIASSLTDPSKCRKQGLYLLEGPRFVNDHLESGCSADFILLSTEASDPCLKTAALAEEKGIRIVRTAEHIFSSTAPTRNSQGLLAVCPIPCHETGKLSKGGPVLVLDGVGDPGNAGTAVRSAAAFGSAGVVFLRGSVFPWSPKVTRAAAGLNSRFPVIEIENLEKLKDQLPEHLCIGACAGGDDPACLKEADKICLVIGSETHGIREPTRRFLDGSVSIPMRPGVESLNAGVSASILLYELFRRKP